MRSKRSREWTYLVARDLRLDPVSRDRLQTFSCLKPFFRTTRQVSDTRPVPVESLKITSVRIVNMIEDISETED
jgi:hypothetical protein